MALRIVLFDMDGVLVDVSGSYRRAIEETAAHFTGSPVVPGTVQRFKNRGGFNDDWRLTEAIVREAGFDVPFEDIVAAFNRRYRGGDWDGYIRAETPLIDDATLTGLTRRYSALGVVTGRPRAEAEWSIRHFGWTDLFRVVVALEDQDGKGKPDPFPLTSALDRLSALTGSALSAAESVYIGDSIDDMMAARAAGMKAVGFEPPYLRGNDLAARLVRAGAQFVIGDHRDLDQVLRTLE